MTSTTIAAVIPVGFGIASLTVKKTAATETNWGRYFDFSA